MLKNLLNGQTLYFEEVDDQSGSGAPDVSTETDADTDTDTDDSPAPTIAKLKQALDEQKKAADRQAAQLRRKYERKQKELEQKLAAMAADESDPSSNPDPAPEPSSNPSGQDPATTEAMQFQARLERQVKETQKRLDKLQKEADELEARRKQEEQKRKELERDTLVRSAIQKAGVLSDATEFAFDHFVKRTVWDETYGEWAFKDGDDYLPVEETITERMPDWLKPRRSRSGSGSGNISAGSAPARGADADLKAAKDKLNTIMEDIRAQNGRGDFTMKDYYEQKNKVKALEKGS